MWFFFFILPSHLTGNHLRKASHTLVQLSSPQLSIHAPSLSWNPHSWLHRVLTDCTTSHLENLSWPLRIWGCCLSVKLISKYYPLSSLRLALVRGCPCLLKRQLPWRWERGRVLFCSSSTVRQKRKPVHQLGCSPPLLPSLGLGELLAALAGGRRDGTPKPGDLQSSW